MPPSRSKQLLELVMQPRARIETQFAVVVVLLTVTLTLGAHAQGAPEKREGKIVCGSFSGDPKKFPAWTDDVTIAMDRGALVATPSRPQGQVMRGVVAPSGAILLAGEGGMIDGVAEWTYEFAGKLNPKGPTVIRGQLADIKGGPAKRQCSISF
jgi:hypothetical protein